MGGDVGPTLAQRIRGLARRRVPTLAQRIFCRWHTIWANVGMKWRWPNVGPTLRQPSDVDVVPTSTQPVYGPKSDVAFWR